MAPTPAAVPLPAPATAPAPPAAKTSWKESFELGISAYKSKDYAGALDAFDKAVKSGGKRVVVLDSRAVVLEKVGRVKDALQDARAIIELTPKSPKGYIRASHLFELLGMIPQAHQMLLLAIPLSPPAQADSLQTRKITLDVKFAAYHKSKVNHIQTLPAELLTAIGHHLSESDTDVALVLAGVSRHWRAVFLDDAKMWSRLKLGRKRTMPKAQAYWERSKGMLVSLDMDMLSTQLARPVLDLVASSFERLEALRWLVDAGQARAEVDPHLMLARGRCANLRSLRIEYSARTTNQPQSRLQGSTVWSLFPSPCTLETLAICNAHAILVHPPAELGLLDSIRHLDVSDTGIIWSGDLSADWSHFLDRFPNLESLNMSSAVGPFVAHPNQRSGPVILNKLREVNFAKSDPSGARGFVLSAPILERADLSHVIGWPLRYIFPREPTTGEVSTVNVSCLTHLKLTRTSHPENEILDHLRLIPTLTHLSIASCNLTNKTFETLTLSLDGEGIVPALEHLDMSYSETATGGPVCRMVASRKGQGRYGRGLRSLLLDGCPLIELKAVEWLMAKVDRVSCKVVLEKKKR